MIKRRITVERIPAILWGSDPSEKAYLVIHGKQGCKEAAESFAQIAVRKGWQVLSIDLPEHGERKQEKDTFNPWHVVPELKKVMACSRQRWKTVSLCAESIGAWFSLLSFADDPLQNCLFISPILDMQRLIADMMSWASVSEERLFAEQEIPTSFGETLSWKYFQFAKEHPIRCWDAPTAILYPECDQLTSADTVSAFIKRFDCACTPVPNAEHWLHTPGEIRIRNEWLEEHI